MTVEMINLSKSINNSQPLKPVNAVPLRPINPSFKNDSPNNSIDNADEYKDKYKFACDVAASLSRELALYKSQFGELKQTGSVFA